jgi:tetratricopeptide (TPR) repeat protein
MQESRAGFSGIQGAIQIMNAEYEQAIASLSNANESAVNLFNKGLAQLLNKDFENAITSFDEAANMDSDFALAHYGKAIANARMQNESATYESLQTAVSEDPDLKAKALNDLEFRNYAGASGFQDAIK